MAQGACQARRSDRSGVPATHRSGRQSGDAVIPFFVRKRSEGVLPGRASWTGPDSRERGPEAQVHPLAKGEPDLADLAVEPARAEPGAPLDADDVTQSQFGKYPHQLRSREAPVGDDDRGSPCRQKSCRKPEEVFLEPVLAPPYLPFLVGRKEYRNSSLPSSSPRFRSPLVFANGFSRGWASSSAV